MDFGLARGLGDNRRRASSTAAAGTPDYMAPEQVEGRQPTTGLRYLRPRRRHLRAAHRAATVLRARPLTWRRSAGCANARPRRPRWCPNWPRSGTPSLADASSASQSAASAGWRRLPPPCRALGGGGSAPGRRSPVAVAATAPRPGGGRRCLADADRAARSMPATASLAVPAKRPARARPQTEPPDRRSEHRSEHRCDRAGPGHRRGEALRPPPERAVRSRSRMHRPAPRLCYARPRR